jgi:hypothetical protein
MYVDPWTPRRPALVPFIVQARQSLPTYSSLQARKHRRDTSAGSVPRVFYRSRSRIRSPTIEKTNMRDRSPVHCLEKSDPGPVAIWRGCRSLAHAVACPVCMYVSGEAPSRTARAHQCPPADALTSIHGARVRSWACTPHDAGPYLSSPSLRAKRERRRAENAPSVMVPPVVSLSRRRLARVLVHVDTLSRPLFSHLGGELRPAPISIVNADCCVLDSLRTRYLDALKDIIPTTGTRTLPHGHRSTRCHHPDCGACVEWIRVACSPRIVHIDLTRRFLAPPPSQIIAAHSVHIPQSPHHACSELWRAGPLAIWDPGDPRAAHPSHSS